MSSKAKHPTTAEMVKKAILDLNDRQGSSLYMLKKYISDKFEININSNLKKRITTSVKDFLQDGTLVQVSGFGANGKFKLSKNAKNSMKIKRKAKPKRNQTITNVMPKVKLRTTQKKSTTPNEKKKESSTATKSKPKKNLQHRPQ